MKLDDLATFFDDPIRTLTTNEGLDALLVGGEVYLHPFLQDKYLLLKQGENNVSFDLTAADMWVTSSDDWLWVLRSVKGKTIRLQALKTMPVIETFSGKFNVAVDEKIRDEVARKAGFNNPSIEGAALWLNEEFVLREGDGSRILQARYHGQDNQQTINLLGRNFLLVLEATANGALWVRRLSPVSRNRDFSIAIIDSGIDFVDATIAAQLANPEEVEKLKALRRDHSSYIALWEEYDRIADRRAKDDARKTGYISYVKHEQENTVDGVEWRFYFKKDHAEKVDAFYKAIKSSDGIKLELDKELPGWLTNQSSIESNNLSQNERRLTATLVKKTPSYLVLSLDRGIKPSSTGFLYTSLAGTETSSKRRREARDNINSQKNAMPQLCHLIEGLPVKAPRYRYIKPMSSSAKESFSGEPTEKQIDALDLALNTPDIALILGPPGTGKTQIISALQRRLADEAGKVRMDITREVLVSSFQHDAVDNVVARSEVFGLPAIRVGRRERSAAILQQWINKQRSAVTEVLENEEDENECFQLIELIRKDVAILLYGGPAEEEFYRRISDLASSLEKLGDQHDVVISSSLKAKLGIASQRVTKKAGSNVLSVDKELLRCVRALRVDPISFEDDGVDCAFACLCALERSKVPLTMSDASLLQSMSEYYEQPPLASLELLADLKARIIERLLPDYRPMPLRTKLDAELEMTLKDITTELTGQLATSAAGIPDILREYAQTLSYQKGRVKKTVEDYTTTLGATCQGAVSTEMLNTLSAMGQENISFDTVIVDEAARANPLDLFIPMSLGRRRIVLVGDHYQLPQILEPDIEGEMRESGVLTETFDESLKESLFERLYVQLKEREKNDGIRRTVMLDTQFRMHPEIGRFVSENFYENNGEPPVKSGLGESHFTMTLAGYDDAIMHWVDVPITQGAEKRSGSSWVRHVEADRVAEIAAKIVHENENISVGVITFYAHQREAIFSSLESKNICRRGEDGWEYEPAYISTHDGEERIRVGSVDAFQGKEFDVVILSMTRSNKLTCTTEQQLNRKYGFLRLQNRLNVAFSRAKKRLIAVGDRKMFSGEEAKAALPSVHQYAVSLCGDSK